jgi:flagellar biosynthesis/type III secretory pathway chaperone
VEELTFQELIDRLEDQKDLYRRMMELGRQKQKELIMGDLERIDILTKEEENFLYQAERLEEQRYQCASRLIAHYQLPENATLKDLIQVAPSADRSKLEELQQSMNQMVSELDKLNQENIALIQQSLKFINFTVDLLTKPDDVGTYGSGKDKNKKQDSVSRILDKKI